MASSSGDNQVFEQLIKNADEEEQEKPWEAKAAQRKAGLVSSNTTLPVTISSIEVHGAPRTRRGFLERIFKPILDKDSKGTTLEGALKDIGDAHSILQQLDIFEDPISAYIDQPDKADASTTPTDLAVHFHAKEKGAWKLTTGVETGHDDGSGFVNLHFRNIFGGAESLDGQFAHGTRTRNSWSAFFQSPILSNPNLSWSIGGLQNVTTKPFAGHEEVLKSGLTNIKWFSAGGHRHELSYQGSWRQNTGLTSDASPSVRHDAGDSFKSSISHTWTNDRRDVPLLPRKGYLMKTIAEIAGLGPLRGDVAFAKLEAETQAALPLPLGVSFTAGLKAGLLQPLTLAGQQTPSASRINDRFQLGGANDVRGFRMAGIGPRDGSDSIGGDVYAAGGASLTFPIPKVDPETPLRLQAFVNGGKLLGLQGGSKDSPDGSQGSLKSTITELKNGLPTLSAGVGLIYVHPVARFELNFCLPIHVNAHDQARKGLQFGVGVDFL